MEHQLFTKTHTISRSEDPVHRKDERERYKDYKEASGEQQAVNDLSLVPPHPGSAQR